MIKEVFKGCVDLLLWVASKTNATYETVNVVIFCLLWPVITVILIAVIVWQRRRYNADS